MYTKSQSCDRCLRQNPSFTAEAHSHKTKKKPESYLSKKFDELYEEVLQY